MSESIRQNNLFAAEDWRVIYNAFRNVNLQAYDYESIYNALIDYLRENNPDEFNDYVQHSEIIAHINMLAYLGQMYAFRIDLNARENFFDTAERRESVINLAQALSYKPKRNRAAHGLCKITSVNTTQPITDTQGNNLAGREITWDQINNPNWFENFIRVLNNAFNSVNRFGDPVKDQLIDGIRTELYSINASTNAPVVYPFSTTVNGKPYNFEITSSDLTESIIKEREPLPHTSFNILYRNDESGNNSPNTGFFVFFKQGTLNSNDYQYERPVPEREETIEVDNINETDVWLQEIDQQGYVKRSWTQIPSLVGQNVIYNDVFLGNRYIYAASTLNNNQVKIKYSDGNFGAVPLGTFRAWYRSSENESFTIRPNDIQNETITIPYIGNDNQRYSLTLKFSLETAVDNSESEESIDDIRKNAPLTHYTQDRMINGEDYNIFPLTQSNLVRKVKSVNRTHAGHSRYIDITDPTGAHSNVSVVGEDGYIYKDYRVNESIEDIEDNTNFNAIVRTTIEGLMNDYGLLNFYYHTFRQTVLSNDFQQVGGLGSDYFSFPSRRYIWKSLPNNEYNNTGYFVDTSTDTNVEIGTGSNTLLLKFLRNNSKVLFKNNYGDEQWVTIKDVEQGGLVNLNFMTRGRVELSDNVRTDWYVAEVIPGIRRTLTGTERGLVEEEMVNNRSFGLRYDFEEDIWEIISQENIGNDSDLETFDLIEPELPNENDNRWLIKCLFLNQQGDKQYRFYSRGLRYVFGSDKQVRFFFKNTSSIIDYETGEAVKDHIKILQSNTNRSNIQEQETKARAVIGTLYTSSTHNSTTEYDITNMVPYNTNYGNVKIYTATNGKREITDWTITFDNQKTLLQLSSALLPENTVTPFLITDMVDVFDLETNQTGLKRSYDLSLSRTFIREDGVIDYSKILVEPIDADEDGVPDYPLAFEDIVDLDNYIFFKSYEDFDNVIYDRVDNDVELINDNTTTIEENVIYYCKEDITILDNEGNYNNYEQGKFYKGVDNTQNGLRLNKAEELIDNKDDNGDEYSAYIGRAFSDGDPFMFNWKHYAGDRERIDISVSNIIDMYVLTRGYDNAVRSWLKNRESLDQFPSLPTSNEIKNNIRFIEANKSTSDQIIYIPAQYRLLFGETALPEYQATFKVIKLPGTNLTDNEIKSRVIESINEFFNIQNWDFGSGFYYTELSTYIHTNLVGHIGSVVIVPQFESSSFGELFEIRSEPNELFLSTATVDNVEIVKTYTDTNLRKR